MKKAREFTLFGDLDGLTIRELKNFLTEFSDNDVICANTRAVFTWSGEEAEEEFFTIEENTSVKNV